MRTRKTTSKATVKTIRAPRTRKPAPEAVELVGLADRTPEPVIMPEPAPVVVVEATPEPVATPAKPAPKARKALPVIDADWNDVVARYQAGATLAELGKLVGTSWNRIWAELHARGVDLNARKKTATV